ncbi:PepSY domain-containing protein [Pseudomonas sp. RIT-PI-AD]|uniref:PepSY-associated TM helix domain-containing protein n=1 Tax=Pseudomonas sp. RIT-PI-AD TaxID=3035294 RepID=UPI0021DABDE8|nr:PepSY domain-containing protein [Pseudomonas sp. RIT-PI-AD]
MSKKSRSKIWFLVHGWLALPIWVFALLVCLTGTLAVVSQEIVWLATPQIRASAPSDDAQPLSYQRILQALAEQEPTMVVESLRKPEESHFALSASVTYPDARSAVLYVDPYTGRIQGSAPDFDFRGFTRALHGWWLVPFTHGFSWGWYMVCLLGPLMLASLVTGLVVYKRFWRGFLTPRLRFNQGARIFWGDFHRLAGIWSIWFIAVISITGTWFLLRAILSDLELSVTPIEAPVVNAREAVPTSATGDGVARLDLDQATKLAEQAIPGLEVSYIGMPENAYDVLHVGGRDWYPLMYQSASLDPYSGRVMNTYLKGDRPLADFIIDSMYPLHYGDFGGLAVKLIWFFFGLLLSLMVLSGLLIWTKRTALATAKPFKKARPPREPRAPSGAPTAEHSA